jgi:hypothetical protein
MLLGQPHAVKSDVKAECSRVLLPDLLPVSVGPCQFSADGSYSNDDDFKKSCDTPTGSVFNLARRTTPKATKGLATWWCGGSSGGLRQSTRPHI